MSYRRQVREQVATCEGCGAPLFDGDDYAADDYGVYGCWAAMTEDVRDRPCYADRVGRLGANLDCDALTGCADDQTWASVPTQALRDAASAIEAATAGETVQQGSTEGESAVAKPDAQPPSGDS